MFARTKKGSNRHEVMRLKVAKQYRKITNMRTDFLHKLTTDLVNRFDTICLENLNVDRILKVCPVCGEHHDRDVNAAINIKKLPKKIHYEEIA